MKGHQRADGMGKFRENQGIAVQDCQDPGWMMVGPPMVTRLGDGRADNVFSRGASHDVDKGWIGVGRGV